MAANLELVADWDLCLGLGLEPLWDWGEPSLWGLRLVQPSLEGKEENLSQDEAWNPLPFWGGKWGAAGTVGLPAPMLQVALNHWGRGQWRSYILWKGGGATYKGRMKSPIY